MTFVAELRNKCIGLGDMSLGFPLVPRYAHRAVRLRVHVNYRIFYRTIGDPIERIDILYIIHGARDYAASLLTAIIKRITPPATPGRRASRRNG